jgi:hypothetical protein
VYLLGENPQMDKMQSFVQRLGGLVKYALSKKEGRVVIPELAAATAQYEVAVLCGMDWLVTRGKIAYERDDSVLILSAAGASIADSETVKQVDVKLWQLLSESAAYRSYWHRASMDALRGK